jgi:heat shock protein HslJ
VEGDPATLRLGDDGTIEGSTGCRPFSGTYVVTGDTVAVTELAMGDVVCPPQLGDQDSHVVTVLGDGFIPAIERERLTLESMGGLGLAYQAG